MKRGIALSAAIAAAFAATPTHADVLAAAPPCGAATQATVVRDYRAAALTIYHGELDGQEVKQDLGHVLASHALAAGLADRNSAAVLAATHEIVYHRRWHIVRLRVLSGSGSVVADIGGPHVIAPVRGQISYRGKTVGSFVMSVQDDVGYAKLVQRFTGRPIEIYVGGQPVEGEGFPPASLPARLPANGSALSIGGVRYVAATYAVEGFPSVGDRALLAVPLASPGLKASSCLNVDAVTYTQIAIHLAQHVPLPKDAGVFVGVVWEFDPSKLVFVLSGSSQLASSNRAAAPPGLPLAGSITYNGQQWLVKSFAPVSGVRVYLLYPEGQPVGATGSSGAS